MFDVSEEKMRQVERRVKEERRQKLYRRLVGLALVAAALAASGLPVPIRDY